MECVDSVGDGAGPSTGVGGVTKVLGASAVFGGVAGSWVMMRLGPKERNEAVDWVSGPVWIRGGEATMASSRTRCSRFLPPKRAPIPPVVEGGLGLSVAAGLGEVARRAGWKASFSLPTGETPRLLGVRSVVLAVRVDVSESTRVASAVIEGEVVAAESSESMVSEAMRGDDSVRSPAWELWGEMRGRRGGALRGG